MSTDIRPPDPDEPAVRAPELRAFIAAARAQPAPVLRVSADDIFAGYQARRRAQRRIGLGLALAAAAVIALVSAQPWKMLKKTGSTEPVASNMVYEPSNPALAEPVRVAGGEGPAPRVRGPWEVELAVGSYDIEVAEHPGGEQLRVATPHGTLEIAHGFVHVVVAGDRTETALRIGVATWTPTGGARTPLTVESAQPAPDASLGPAELARRADAELAAGRRDAAIDTLRDLVTRFPDSSHARPALLDLARLLRAAGRTDESRCAHALYLQRYPGKQHLADEVAESLARLGPGPACDGLRPHARPP